MPLHPIKTLIDGPRIALNPQALMERPDVAAWVAQCIANWSWVDSATGTLFVNLVGTNMSAGAILYAEMTSALAKDRSLRALGLARLEKADIPLLEALMSLLKSGQATRDKLAHWYWGVCEQIPDGLVLVDPRYLMKHRANMLELYEKGELTTEHMAFDISRFFVVRIKDLQAEAKAFAELAKLVFSFANWVAMQDKAERARRRLVLSNDARIREVLARGGRSGRQRNPPVQTSPRSKSRPRR
jgi:hypothetical protein